MHYKTWKNDSLKHEPHQQHMREEDMPQSSNQKQKTEPVTYLDSVIMIPANLGWKLAQQAVLVSCLKPQDPTFSQNPKTSHFLK